MKTVLVTGASSGIGREVVRLFAKNNYNVVITYNSDKKCALELESEVNSGNNTLVLKCDISNEEDIIKMVNSVRDKFNSIDVLVNNAGIAIDTTFEDKTKVNFMKILEVNLVGTFFVSKYVSEIMLKNKNGRIINISSTNAIDSYYVESLDYDASKAGIISLTHNLANYLSPYVNVNCVCPGWVDTRMNSDISLEFRKKQEDKILLGRFANPREIANVVYFLSSEEASYINDSIIKVDGGVKND